jgi:predicted RNA-binding protein
VAVTASVFNWEKKDILSYGFDDFVAKPFRIEDIYQSIASMLDIDYNYSNEIDHVQANLTNETLQDIAIPSDLYEELLNAIELSDVQEIENALENIAQIGNDEHKFSEQLSRLLINYEFDAMLELVKGTAHAIT